MCGDGTVLEENASDLLQEKAEINEVHEDELEHAITTIKKLETVLPIPRGCEATRRAYFDPILVAGARIAKGVTMAVERNVEAPLANGPVDYLFKIQDHCIICVT